ncbi:ABC transporter ATP-binding protein [Pseudohongiella sp.]|uniref:ABC transporter domain-containing protein n=1 Tax=marine sediment metagenome TaxID=412755 RepID=A0A0F9Z651_9ZZZZ|nr:oligopeptide/dipeptide ABC transporter ATP-binding protein [Pseudohongiella sp.]HDZ08137.1 ATP-binding cassette domain-containing protein [Pseudohongiella sp.]HEA63105.1 ATP-binding cassette domain-containing protein [Pseudohongiella sp.]
MTDKTPCQLRERDDIVLRVAHLSVNFAVGKQTVQAVTDVSFDVARGETLGLVGESGCGKSTIGRAIMQLPPPSAGAVIFRDQDMTVLSGEALRQTRTGLQMIFQDPVSSLNPRRRVRDIIAEGLTIWGRDNSAARVEEVMSAVGLDAASAGDRRPHQFSGGQCQRICIARSLALDPDVLICDEPVSALDVSVQAQILNLLEDMKARYHLTMVFIAHNLAVVKNISDRVAVMYLGKLCEIGNTEAIYSKPVHPYTRALLASIPDADPLAREQALLDEEPLLQGELPSPADPPSGCRFRTRCPYAQERCAREEPFMQAAGDDHFVACHFPLL